MSATAMVVEGTRTGVDGRLGFSRGSWNRPTLPLQSQLVCGAWGPVHLTHIELLAPVAALPSEKQAAFPSLSYTSCSVLLP